VQRAQQGEAAAHLEGEGECEVDWEVRACLPVCTLYKKRTACVGRVQSERSLTRAIHPLKKGLQVVCP